MANDYAGNSKKAKEKTPETPEDKKIERVVVGEVIIQKKSVRHRLKSIFLEADLRTVIRYVATTTLIPAAKAMLLDSINGGSRTWIYGEAATRRQNINPGPRTQYSNPQSLGVPYVPSGSGGILGRVAPPVSPEPRQQTRFAEDIVILASKDEAEMVLERMQDALDTYQVVTLSDFKALIGSQHTHVDYKWGWTSLAGAHIRTVREGWLIDLPPVEVI